jgi:hypothetical protein
MDQNHLIETALAQASTNDDARSTALNAIAHFLRPLMHSESRLEVFHTLERAGVHVTPVHFYSPIPSVAELSGDFWRSRDEVPAVKFNEGTQLHLLEHVFPSFRDEYSAIPNDPVADTSAFYLRNDFFGGTDALASYCMIRHFHPRRIVEVGSGYSSRLAALACEKNGDTELICIEPFPDDILDRGFSGLTQLRRERVQDVDQSLFATLGPNDILFIDSSHVVRTGGDVTYLFLEVIPRLGPGVLVHVHDIFLPDEVRRDWLMDELRFWTEQYLLQAFLICNDAFEILLANHFLHKRHPEAMRATFPTSPWWGGGSFWMRRRERPPPTREAQGA